MQSESVVLKAPERINSIDALRGLAALIIILYHARSMFWIGLGETWRRHGLDFHLNSWLGYATAPLSFGGLAVGLFFVLSGYCIHRRGAKNLAINPTAKLDLKKYFFKRFWRIYPTYFAALCVTALVDFYVRQNNLVPIPEYQSNSLLTFIVSLFSLQGIVAPVFGHNTSLWTLAIEIHFYLLYPFLYSLSAKYGAKKVLIGAFLVSFIYSIINYYIDIHSFFPYKSSGDPLFIPYLFTWVFGFYIAEIEAKRAKINEKYWFICAITTVVLIPITYAINYSDFTMFISTVGFGYLLYWSIKKPGITFWGFLPGRILTKIGLISYSIYVIHRPTLLIFKATIFGKQQQFETIIPVFFVTLAAIICGWILF